jgi:hypothetical protein
MRLNLSGILTTPLTRKPFYITSSRYRSMLNDCVTPTNKIHILLGSSAYPKPASTTAQRNPPSSSTLSMNQSPHDNCH